MSALKAGYVLTTLLTRGLYEEGILNDDMTALDMGAGDLVMEALDGKKDSRFLTKCKNVNPAHYRLDDIDRDLNHDRNIWNTLVKLADEVLSIEDCKLTTLHNTLCKIHLENKEKEEGSPRTKSIVFTYFRDTAIHIFSQLKNLEPNWKMEIISGGTSSQERLKLVHRFAPFSNQEDLSIQKEDIPKLEDQLDILISTDVLSEGQNLQDANHIINYDLHWNPVRMIQRAGRIDRLKSLHDEITVHNFFVEDGLEELLGLMERIFSRLNTIDATIELDGAVLRPELVEKQHSDIFRIRDEKLEVWDEYEAQIEFSDQNPTKEQLQRLIADIGHDTLRKRPIGIHSGVVTAEHSGLIAAIEIYYDSGGKETRWVFEPDDPSKYEGLLKDGLLTTRHTVEKLLRCDPTTPRMMLEGEELFSRVQLIRDKIARNLRDERITRMEDLIYAQGSRKYAKIILRCMKEKTVKRDFGKRFLHYAKVSSFSQLKRDLSEITLTLDNGWKELEQHQRHKGRSYSAKREIREARGKLVNEFLSGVYEYFDKYNIVPEVPEPSRTYTMRLVGFLRLLTPSQINAT